MAEQGAQSENAAAPPPAVWTLLVEASKANDAVLFYKAAFGAEEVPRNWNPFPFLEDEPLIVSAELKIRGVSFLVAYRADDSPTSTPVKLGQNGSVIFALTSTDDVDGLIAKAVGAGAVAEGKTTERVVFCGDGALGRARVANVMDPYGFVWQIRSPRLGGGLLERKFDGLCISKI